MTRFLIFISIFFQWRDTENQQLLCAVKKYQLAVHKHYSIKRMLTLLNNFVPNMQKLRSKQRITIVKMYAN